MMEAGKLDRKITLQQKTVTTDAEGFPVETWNDFATLWSSIEPLKGHERYEAAAVNAETDIRIRIRYRPGVKSDMRIIYGARTFQIRAVIDVNDRHREIQLMCQELLQNG